MNNSITNERANERTNERQRVSSKRMLLENLVDQKCTASWEEKACYYMGAVYTVQ